MESNRYCASPLLTNSSIITFEIGVLLERGGLNVINTNFLLQGPFLQSGTDVFQIIVAPNGLGLTSPFDDLLQAANQAQDR
jgi:hypothetical protein